MAAEPTFRARSSSSASLLQARAAIYTRLQARCSEIEQVVLSRISALSSLSKPSDPEYLEGLRTSIAAAIAYGLAIIESGEEHAPPIPAVLLTQARTAARHGVSLDTVLRRYLAGYTLLGDFLIHEAEAGDLLRTGDLKHLLRTQATLFDRLLEAVSAEHARETCAPKTFTQLRAERIRQLLTGESFTTADYGYDFDAWHVGAITDGDETRDIVRELASTLDCRLLLTPQREGVLWIWFGTQRQLDPSELRRHISSNWPKHTGLAIGEAAKGLNGWRLTHRQAKVALSIVTPSSGSVVRYADVALLASMFQDDLLAVSLRELCLVPLERARGGGAVLRETLRAYFRSERNVSSAAAVLGVSRQTVANRLNTVEQLLNRPLNTCAAEIDAALKLDALGRTDHTLKYVCSSADART